MSRVFMLDKAVSKAVITRKRALTTNTCLFFLHLILLDSYRDIVELLNRVQGVIRSIVTTPRPSNIVVYRRPGVSI